MSEPDPLSTPSQPRSAPQGSAEQFRLFFEQSPLGYQSLDAHGRLLAVNQAWLDLLGYAPEAVLGKPFANLLTSKSQSRLAERFAQFQQTGAIHNTEFDMVRSDGNVITVSFHGRTAHDAQGRFICTHCILNDITERKRAEERAAHIRRVLLAIRNVNQLIVHESDRQRLIDRACANLTETLGYTSAWIVLVNDRGEATMTAASGFGGEFETLRGQLERGQLPPCVQAAIRDAGTVIVNCLDDACRECPLSAELPDQGHVSRALLFGGKVYGVLTVTLPAPFVHDDESQGLFVELAGDLAFALRKIDDGEALRESEERYRLLLENASDAIYVHEVTPEAPGRFLEANLRACELLGYTRDEFLGMSVGQIDVPDQAARVPAILRTLDETGSAVFETEHVAKDGQRIPVEVSTRLFRLRDRPVVLSVVRDIRQRKAAERRLGELQRELAHASRLAALGESTAGFAHEVNQPLCSIMNFAKACTNLAAREPVDLAQIRQWVEAIGAAASQAGDMIRRLLDFARRDRPERQTVPLARLAEDAMLLVAHEARANGVAVWLDSVDPALLVHVQTVAIQQVLVNLLRNSIEALAKSRRHDRRVVIRAVRQGDWVNVSVVDNGPGFDPALHARVFRPFVTTKPHGVGLGLSISKTIVEGHGGSIGTATGEEGGLAVYFTLPAGKE